jgi:hypothetical protein
MLGLLGGGRFVHIGGGVSPMVDVAITLSSIVSSGNTIVNGWPDGLSLGGGLMAVISSGSNLTASGISVLNVSVSNNTGMAVLLQPPGIDCRDERT